MAPFSRIYFFVFLRPIKHQTMKKLLAISVCLFLTGISFTVKSQQTMTDDQKISYALGANAGENFKGVGIDINQDLFMQGLRDALEGKNQFSREEMEQIFNVLNQRIQEAQKKIQEAQSKDIDVEKAKGAAFLAENKTRKGVMETPSGLQYEVVKMGNGPKPTATDRVKVHYHGTTLDGQVFDSSVQRGETITFGLNQVISGWTEGVQLMPVGSKFIFYIPSHLAYGDQSVAGGVIKPGSTLIFEVELFDINPQE